MLSNVKLTAANVPHKESLTTEEKALFGRTFLQPLLRLVVQASSDS